MIDPSAPTEEMRAVRPLTPPDSSGAALLSPEQVRSAVARSGFLGLLIALMAPAGYFFERFTQPSRVASPAVFPFPPVVATALFAAGLLLCIVAWSHRVRDALVVDLSLIFEVVVAFAIALSENSTPWPPDHPIRGISWNCLWISIYVITIPATYGKTVLAAVAAAAMAPFGMLVAHVVNGNPFPTPAQTAILLLPPFAAAAWSIPVARYLHRLGRQVSRARAMGSYELVELIGRGGMGEVWRAQHRMLARAAAIKLIRPEALGGSASPEHGLLLRRFEREARATAALSSPHTVVLYDYGLSGEGNFYYVMELLDGIDLESLVLRFGPQPAARVVRLLDQVAQSLAEAHEHGLVHRDIKPRNIFSCRMGLEYDFVKVLDFGLVKVRSAEEARSTLTRTGATPGTPAYMAPEIATGAADIDGRADLYSLGCVGYWLLTGQLVFDAPNSVALMLAHLQAAPVPPSRRIAAPVPEPLERLILACLEKQPVNRPASAREVIAALSSRDLERWSAAEAEAWWREHALAAPA